MKKIFVIAALLSLTWGTMAQDSTMNKMMPVQPAGSGKYCAALKDGKTVLTSDGMLVSKDVTFPEGSTLTVNAVLIKKDGSIHNLNIGECVDKNTVNNNAKTQR